MSMYPQALGTIPQETARIAQAAYAKGNLVMRLREVLSEVYQDEQFAHLFAARGRPAEAPWRLVVVTVLQHVEGLTDRQAAEAVRGRLDWKYTLGLELADPGFDYTLLSDFRSRLLAGGAATLLLDVLVEHCQARGYLRAGGRQRTDSTHVLASVRALSHLETVGETLRAALEDLAAEAPDWLAQHISSAWLVRYGHRIEQYRLPKEKSRREALALQIGADGMQLLRALEQPDVPEQLRELESVQVLAQVWQQYYEQQASGQLTWCSDPKVSETQRINSPYDTEARAGHKRELVWLGYKVHLTETCEQEAPHLIVGVQTTPAPVTDVEMTAVIHAALAEQHLLPSEHLVDTGYVDGQLVVESQQRYGLRVVGPVLPDSSWQARAGQGFTQSQFQVDWQHECVMCPQGQTSRGWKHWHDHEHGDYIRVQFAPEACQRCPVQRACTHAKTGGRTLNLHPQPVHEAMQQRRQEQTTPQFQREYALRAGVEATLSQGVRRFGLRRSRYVGLSKTHLQHVLTAVAINLLRIDAWLSRPAPPRKRQTHLNRLASHLDLRQEAAG